MGTSENNDGFSKWWDTLKSGTFLSVISPPYICFALSKSGNASAFIKRIIWVSSCKTHQCSAKNRTRQSSVVSGKSKPGASGDFESQATQSQASHFWQPLWDATLAVRMKFRLSMCQWHTQQKTAAECATHFLNTGKTCQYNEEPMKNHKWWLILATERVLTTK